GPDGDAAILEMTALPAEWLTLGPGAEDELPALFEAAAGLGRVDVVDEVLVRRAADEPGDETAAGQVVDHGELFSDAQRVAERHKGAQDRDSGALDALAQRRGLDGDVGGQAEGREMVLRAS